MVVSNKTNNGVQMTVQMATHYQQITLQPGGFLVIDPGELPPNSTYVQLTPLAIYGVMGSMDSWNYTNISDDQCVTFIVEVK